MRYKTATEKMHAITAEIIDRETKDIFTLETTVFSDLSEQDIEMFLEDMATQKTTHKCRVINYEITATHEYTYRMPYTQYLMLAEIWKIDGQKVK